MPKFILSKSKVIEQYNNVKQFGLVSYSLKTNPIVGQVLEKETDSMFSVHFINELRFIKDKSKVWFLAQALNNELLDNLFKQGVNKFVIENIEDLNTLINYINKNNKQIWLLLRMKLKEHTLKTERYYVFGMESKVINKKVKQLYKQLHNSKSIEKIGIHVHRKTQNVSEWRLKEELSEIIEAEVLKKIDFINIGGGIPVQYKNITNKIIPAVFSRINEIKQWADSLSIQLILEPGRYISGPSIKLETSIAGIHGNTIVVDASVYNSSMDTLIVPIKLLVEGEVEKSSNTFQYIIKGITPCSMDIFRYKVYFNEKKSIGDKIIFLNAGAYNFHTEFCELNKIKTVVVK